MKTIWKYELKGPLSGGMVEIGMPKSAVVVHFAMQGPMPCLWVFVDTDDPKGIRRFQMIGTGSEFPECGKYHGTLQENGFVWHLVELI